ncbi:MAG TPA: CRTAC1 family protein [Kofleriaceae bacterium]|nr:CRTAC1 family protein [Kofleriaceae bacterium]
MTAACRLRDWGGRAGGLSRAAVSGVAICAAALAAGCESPPSMIPPPMDSPDAGCDHGLAFTDISDMSPDLAAHAYGGSPGWDHSDKYAPGLALADFDGDGVLDLAQPRNDRDEPEKRPLVLYRGLGDGRFEVAATPAWEDTWNATGVVAFDYDADSDLDLLVATDRAGVILYRNDGGFKLTNVTEAAGLTGVGQRVYTVAAGDLTGDGLADLYLGQWMADLEDHGEGQAVNIVLENLGDGRFTRSAADLGCYGYSTLGQVLADLDADGDLDVYVANDFFPDCLYENLGDSQFREIGEAAGIGDGAMHAMGAAVGDLNGDGRLDLLITDTQEPDTSPGNAAYIQTEDPLSFASRAKELGVDGLSAVSTSWFVGWGVGIEDFDGDGRNEVHIATHGGITELFFHWQDGEYVPAQEAMAVAGDSDARGAAYGDIDGDGDLDVVVGRRGAGIQILRNDAGGRTVTVAIDPVSLAPGASVVIEANGRRQVHVIQAGSSFMSSGPPTATFGLCGAERASRIEVTLTTGDHMTATDVGPGLITLRPDSPP